MNWQTVFHALIKRKKIPELGNYMSRCWAKNHWYVFLQGQKCCIRQSIKSLAEPKWTFLSNAKSILKETRDLAKDSRHTLKAILDFGNFKPVEIQIISLNILCILWHTKWYYICARIKNSVCCPACEKPTSICLLLSSIINSLQFHSSNVRSAILQFTF